MPWETRPWATAPNEQVRRACRGSALGKRVRLTLDPRSFETDDANELRVEGTVFACIGDGPTLLLEERDVIDGGRIPLIDILLVEFLPAE